MYRISQSISVHICQGNNGHYSSYHHIWRPYLLGRKFYVQSDQHSLKCLFDQRIATPEQKMDLLIAWL